MHVQYEGISQSANLALITRLMCVDSIMSRFSIRFATPPVFHRLQDNCLPIFN